MEQELKQQRVKIFDELSAIVDPEINVSITELELIDEVDIQDSGVKIDLHLTSPFCPAVFGFKICQDIHDNLLKIDGIDDVKVNVSNHFMAEQINNQVTNSPNPHKKEYLFQFDKFKNHFSITYLDYSVDFSFYDKDTAKFEKYMLAHIQSIITALTF